ncbi:MAG: hypothetical protein SVY53_15585 [Chloroflexota bacterium]|nr:hypothetical protein [Chloroflexota bacterium]
MDMQIDIPAIVDMSRRNGIQEQPVRLAFFCLANRFSVHSAQLQLGGCSPLI